MTDIDTRLRAARGLGKDETKASLEAFESLRRRGHPQAPPPIASDGWGGITEAMIKVWGRIPPYRGRGRPPTRKLPGDDWQYLQMIKHRDKRGRLMEIEAKVVFGAEQAVRQLLGENTADAEKNHLTMRHFIVKSIKNGTLSRPWRKPGETSVSPASTPSSPCCGSAPQDGVPGHRDRGGLPGWPPPSTESLR